MYFVLLKYITFDAFDRYLLLLINIDMVFERAMRCFNDV